METMIAYCSLICDTCPIHRHYFKLKYYLKNFILCLFFETFFLEMGKIFQNPISCLSHATIVLTLKNHLCQLKNLKPFWMRLMSDM